MFSSFSKKNIVLFTAIILSLGLVGCGGSNSGTTTPTTTKTGIFADAPVEGLSYKTATQSGFTDAQGHFKYKDGETVEFKLGTLLLGKGKAGTFITPYTISDNNNIATNIAMVLQNFDGNRNNTQVLNLSKLKDFNFTSDINISATPSALQTKLTDLLATGSFQKYIDNTNHDLIKVTKVTQNMDDYIQQYKENIKVKISKKTSNSLPNLNTYNSIAVLQHSSTLYANSYSDQISYIDNNYKKQTVSAGTSCSDFGFSGVPEINNIGYDIVTRFYYNSSSLRSCTEIDNSNAYSNFSGSVSIVFGLNEKNGGPNHNIL